MLGDLNFVTNNAPTNFEAGLGHCGPGWQHRVQTEWLLFTGVICWDDIAFKLTATGRLPADIFKNPLLRMEEAWLDAGLGKQSVNAMIGTFMLDECFSSKLISSNHAGDAPEGALKRTVWYEGGSVTDYIHREDEATHHDDAATPTRFMHVRGGGAGRADALLPAQAESDDQ